MSVEIGGIGQSVKRKEDARFIRGRGNYVDDVKLPGMLYMDIARSPYAHARIKSIDTSKALAIPGVLAVITGKDLVPLKLEWMPTLMSDKQMVLPTDTVLYQAQEVAAVVATSRYIASDGAAAIEVDYEPLPVVVDPKKALLPGATIVREDREQKDNHIWHWEVGDKAGTDKMFKDADVVVKQDIYIPRIHVSSIETCGIVADFDKVDGQLTVWLTTQAPHAIRTVIALVAGHLGLAEHKIRVIAPDIGGGFGGKVPVYPGYVLAIGASVLIGKPVKWIEDRSENIQADSFARDYWITAEVAAKKDGTMQAVRVKTIADHGAFDAAANPSKFPAGLFHIITGSYPFAKSFVEVDGAYTNKPPGGIAYRCSFRVTEAAFTIERMVDILALELKRDPAELRMQNFIQPEAFPYTSSLGWEYDSGNYPAALKLAMEKIDYAGLRKEQLEKRKKGELMGIGISSFTEIVGAGPSKHFDILGIKMFDSAEIRVHPTGKAMVRLGVKSQGQGHETTFAQIVAEELGLPVGDIAVEEGDTDTAPYGLGTYASRSTPVAGGATAIAARKIREKGRLIAAHLLEASPDDIEWKDYKYQVKGVPAKSKTMQEVAFAAYTNHPQGMEAGLEAVDYYDPPNLTYPFGSYICVVDLDRGTGAVKIRRFVAVDDCGTIINPMIVEGQIHGGLTMGLAPALYEQINYDDQGNIQGGNFM
ncbi:MAG: aerobic carbon-monoxide dehydrogenase large subunit, partial [Chloroflexota bacterium]|nr:aerobic carbon-monoxide dehydrogenase large subunit [Chloroflexota bacterium]